MPGTEPSPRCTMRQPNSIAWTASIIGLAAASGCASAPKAAPDTTPEVLIDQSGRVYRTTDPPTEMAFTTSPDSTFRAVSAAYTALGIEPSSVDAAGRVVARQHMILRSRFAGKPLSSSFDCGAGQFGPRADQGRITADIVSRVVGTGSGSTVETTIQAALTPNDGASRDPIRCVSHGGIEESLRREISMQLGVPYEKR
jgi:hypothetical protein